MALVPLVMGGCAVDSTDSHQFNKHSICIHSRCSITTDPNFHCAYLYKCNRHCCRSKSRLYTCPLGNSNLSSLYDVRFRRIIVFYSRHGWKMHYMWSGKRRLRPYSCNITDFHRFNKHILSVSVFIPGVATQKILISTALTFTSVTVIIVGASPGSILVLWATQIWAVCMTFDSEE